MAFNIGPSGNADWLRQKTGGNTGITGGMRRPMPLPPMRTQRQTPQSFPKPWERVGWGSSSENAMRSRPYTGPKQPLPGTPRPPLPTNTHVVRGGGGMRIPDTGIGMGMGPTAPSQQPMEENQLWRTYNRMLGGSVAPRMLF